MLRASSPPVRQTCRSPGSGRREHEAVVHRLRSPMFPRGVVSRSSRCRGRAPSRPARVGVARVRLVIFPSWSTPAHHIAPAAASRKGRTGVGATPNLESGNYMVRRDRCEKSFACTGRITATADLSEGRRPYGARWARAPAPAGTTSRRVTDNDP